MYIYVNAHHITHEISTTHSSKMMFRFIVLETHNAHQGLSRTTPTMPTPMMPEICSKLVPKQVSNEQGGSLSFHEEPKAVHDARKVGRNQRLSQSCTRTAMRLLQLNIGCGHDTAEKDDLEQQLVKNHKATPQQYAVRTSAKYLSTH